MAPPRIALPFQTLVTVNESAADRERMQDLFASGRPTEWRSRLIWGDKKYVLPSLLDEFAGQVHLIYIDPPFATGGDFSFAADVPRDGSSCRGRWRASTRGRALAAMAVGLSSSADLRGSGHQ